MARKATKENTLRTKDLKIDNGFKARALRFFLFPSRLFLRIKKRCSALLNRRPHRSFRRTRRRDYVRPLRLPGYWSLTNQVRTLLWQHKKMFVLLGGIYLLLTLAFIGAASQGRYEELGETIRGAGQQLFQGDLSKLEEAGSLLFTTVTGSLNNTPTETQQVYAGIIGLLTWLTTVWLLRSIMAGHKPRLRDGLYNAGAPILSTFLVALVIVVQLLPAAVAGIGYAAASASGFLNGGIEAMVFWAVALALATLSLYWITSTFIALVVVTLPGMYPMKALKAAGDLVIGRRIRILLRIIWIGVLIAVTWVIVMLPVILFDAWLKGVLPAISWLPVVPFGLLVMATVTIIWSAAYIYVLYRKVVDDDAAPA